jgi:protein translocase SecG subunit
MIYWIKIATIVIAGLLTAAILLQQRGSGLGGAFGADSNVFATKRGIEKVLFIATIVLATLFFGLAVATLFLNS